MWFSVRSSKLSLILFLLRCDLSRADNAPVPSVNSTTTHTTSTSHSSSSLSLSSSSSASSSTTTSSTTVTTSTTTTEPPSTITSAPTFPWGTQILPDNTCSVLESDGSFQYTPCNIFAGTVLLSYFPENSGNVTYPSTYYDPTLSLTLTSPSLYMVVNTLTGDNSCGPLGPTYTSAIISMDLTDVFTLMPFADHTVTTRMGPPQQLTLSDIENGCPGTYATFSTDGAFLNTHPVYGPYNRCHPRFVYPVQLKRLGYPYWMHCSNDDYELGLFDPPGAVPPVSGLLPQTTPAAPVLPTTTPANTIPTPSPSQPSNTSPPQPVITPSSTSSSTTSTTTTSTSNDADPEAPSDPVLQQESSQDPPSDPPSTTQTTPSQTTLSSQSTQPQNVITPPSIPSPTSATPIAVVGTGTIKAIPGSSGVILPNGSTAQPGTTATLTDSHSQPVVVVVATSGIQISSVSGSSTFIPNPTIAPVPIATIGNTVISAAPGATSVVIGTETAFLSGPPVTVGGSVFSLAPTAVVVVGTDGKSSNAFALPTFGTPPPSPSTFKIDGMLVTVPVGATTIVIGDQTITNGGSLITLSNHDVLSLGPSGLIIQMPSGLVSTVTVPPSPVAYAIDATTSSTMGGLGNTTASSPPNQPPASQSTTGASTQATTGPPAQITGNSGSHLDITKALVWMAGCLLLGSVQWM